MKKSTKIALSFCIFALLCICISLAVFAETSYTGTVDGLSAKVTAVENATTAEAKQTALDAVSAYLDATPVDPTLEGYAEVSARIDAQILATAKLFASACDVSLGSAKNIVNVNKLKAFVKAHPLAEDAVGYAEFVAAYNGVIEAQLKLESDTRLKNEASLDVTEYDLPITQQIIDYTTVTSLPAQGNSKPGNFYGVESGKDGDNKYFSIKYTEQAHTFGVYNITNIENGFVVEFDFTTFGKIPSNGVRFENGSVTNSAGTLVYPHYFDIDVNGNVISNAGQVVLEKAIVPGQWIHFALAFDPDAFTYSLYINGQHMDTCTALIGGATHKLSKFRMGKNNKDGEFSIDNFTIYCGSAPRTHGRLETMTDVDKFLFYTAGLTNEESALASKGVAYEYASELLPLFWDAENETYLTEDADIRAAVDAIVSFDYEGLMSAFKAENLQTYLKLCNALFAESRGLDNIAKRTGAIAEINKFVSSNDGMILENADYEAAVAKVGQFEELVLADNNILSFIKKVEKFNTAITLAAMQRHYNAAKVYYDEGLDLSVLETAGFERFAEAYAVYKSAGDIIAAEQRKANSEKIIGCVGMISEYDTEEEWIANYDYINKYVLIVREELRAENYDTTYPGVDAAIDTFHPIDDYFYTDLQKQHIAFISTELERFRSTDSYIERLGICALISGYIDKNDIDESNAELAVLLGTHKTYIGEVEIQGEEYHQVLAQNSAYFNNLVALMQTKSGYNEIKAVFDRAYDYYYAIDASVEGTREAIAVFDTYKQALELAESSSREFVAAVAVLEGANSEDSLYAALVSCCYYAQYADADIDGVAEALDSYTAIYNEYMKVVEGANSDIANAGVAVGSVRSCSGVAPVISVIIKFIFGK